MQKEKKPDCTRQPGLGCVQSEANFSVSIFECLAKLIDDVGQLFDMAAELFDSFVLFVFVLLQVADELIEFRIAELFAFAVLLVVSFVFLSVLFPSFDVFGEFLSMFGDKVSCIAEAGCRQMFGRSIKMLDRCMSVLDPVTFSTTAFTARLFPLAAASIGLFKFLNLSGQMAFEHSRLLPLA